MGFYIGVVLCEIYLPTVAIFNFYMIEATVKNYKSVFNYF